MHIRYASKVTNDEYVLNHYYCHLNIYFFSRYVFTTRVQLLTLGKRNCFSVCYYFQAVYRFFEKLPESLVKGRRSLHYRRYTLQGKGLFWAA